MTTTHTMRIPVHAWRVASDGSLPEEARKALRTVNGLGKGLDRYGVSARFVPAMAHQIDGFRFWYWHDQTAHPGDWIVASAYGLEAMTDEDFRERCTEVGQD